MIITLLYMPVHLYMRVHDAEEYNIVKIRLETDVQVGGFSYWCTSGRVCDRVVGDYKTPLYVIIRLLYR